MTCLKTVPSPDARSKHSSNAPRGMYQHNFAITVINRSIHLALVMTLNCCYNELCGTVQEEKLNWLSPIARLPQTYSRTYRFVLHFAPIVSSTNDRLAFLPTRYLEWPLLRIFFYTRQFPKTGHNLISRPAPFPLTLSIHQRVNVSRANLHEDLPLTKNQGTTSYLLAFTRQSPLRRRLIPYNTTNDKSIYRTLLKRVVHKFASTTFPQHSVKNSAPAVLQ